MYEVGDVVTIRSDLVVNDRYNGVRFIEPMAYLRGRQAHISKRWKRAGRSGAKYGYNLDEDLGGWVWSEEMFEPAAVPLELDEDGLYEILEDLYV